MKRGFSTLLLDNIVSPYGLALVSYAIFLIGCLVPPSIYSHYVFEPDLMFLDPAVIFFYSLCVCFFLLGVWLVGWIGGNQTHAVPSRSTRLSPLVFLLLPLTLGTVLTDISRVLLLKKNPSMLLMLFAQQSGGSKFAGGLEVNGTFAIATMLLIGIVWWSIWRYPELKFRGWRRWLVLIMLIAGILSVLLSATMILSRNQIMMFLCGLAVIYMLKKQIRGEVTWKFVLVSALVFAVAVTSLFILFSFLRGTADWDMQIFLLGGYTLGSYNRLAAVLSGRLHYPFAGRGLYLSPFISFNNSFNAIIPIEKWMHWPSSLEVWGSEASAVTEAGLMGNLFWSGTFGYVFSDLGWFTPLYIFLYGLMYGMVWRWLKAGRALGIVLYPCFAFCILFWVGTNYLLASDPVVLLTVAVFLAGYEFLFVKPLKAPVRSA